MHRRDGTILPEWGEQAPETAAPKAEAETAEAVPAAVETAEAAVDNLSEKPGFRVEYGRLDQADKNRCIERMNE